MNIMIATVGTWGDVLPFIALGVALRDRGHEVTILANSKFEKEIRKADLGYHSIGSAEELDKTLTYIVQEGLVWERGKKASLKGLTAALSALCLNSTRAIFEYISKHNQPGNTLLINNYICLGARYTQDRLDLPGVTVVLCPAHISSKHRPPEQPKFPEWMPKIIKRFWKYLFEELLLLQPLYRRFQDGDIRLDKFVDYRQRVSPDKIICMAPDWFAQPQVDWPSQTKTLGFAIYEGDSAQELSDEVEAYLAEGEPPIIFKSGIHEQVKDSFYRESALACEKMGRRGIFVGVTEEEMPKDLPSCIKSFGYVPLNALLPRSAAMVYHGGVGTSALAFKAGIPHLVLPSLPDQYDIAYLVKRSGVGDTIGWDTYKRDNIVAKLEKLLNSSTVKEVCGVYADKFKVGDPIADFCDEVENLASKKGMLV